MKPFYLLSILLVFSLFSNAQVQGGASYSLSLPLAEMKQNIRPVHGLSVQFLSKISERSKFSWGIEGSFGQYAGFTKDQDIRFPDGSGTNTKVSYSSNVVMAGMQLRYHLLKEKKVIPFIAGRAGYANFFSRVFVADPEHEDDCKPLDKKTPIRDHSFYAGYGAGLQIDISSKKKTKNAWIDISFSHVFGTNLSYINIRDIKDRIQDDPSNPAPISDKAVPLTIRFVNVSTQTIHEHQLAEVYNSALRMLELKVGVVWRLDDK